MGHPFGSTKHESLVTLEMWQKVQGRLREGAKAPVHKSINADFPLRGYIVCDACQHPMTACWAKGRSGRYAYYLCQSKGCPDYRKSIRREKIDAEFTQIVASLQPTTHIFQMAKHMLQLSGKPNRRNESKAGKPSKKTWLPPKENSNGSWIRWRRRMNRS